MVSLELTAQAGFGLDRPRIRSAWGTASVARRKAPSHDTFHPEPLGGRAWAHPLVQHCVRQRVSRDFR